MIPTESEIANQSLLAWDNWLNTAPGLYVLNWEQAQFNRAVDDAFGFDALQIGFPQVGCLNENRISNRWLMQLPSQPTVDISSNHGVHTICQGSIYDLPFASESMDLIALPHVLEFTANPHEALREVHRVLRLRVITSNVEESLYDNVVIQSQKEFHFGAVHFFHCA